ncbi:sigma-70 family RNA polymerase sigma factor [Streptomyces canus]|uniref:RNA polymerase sigma factor n=1 Tax=Streptomyces canus TaxID=58343 RepID=UPI002E2E04FE|nr:sigma-70 family RNA polymerase sigma factor [Streptomyces canus]
MAHTAPADADVAELVTTCLQGDQQAWVRLVDHFTPLVWTIARSHRLSPADCQDVYQLTWLRAVQYLPQLRERKQVAAWLATTARRECLKHIERNQRLVPVGDSSLFDTCAREAEDPDEQALRRADASEVLAAFRLLPSRDQELLGVLMADPPPSYDKASRLLGLPRGSLGPLRQRALGRLRGLLAQPVQ